MKKQYTGVLAGALVLALAAHASAVTPSKPNIIVLLSDDAGYHEFSMQGSKTIPTPRIDSIAANGVRFTDGYVSGCVCSPSRAGLLTGRYQERFGHEFNIPPAYSESNGLPLAEKTVADALKGAGYRTIALGKWHLGYAPTFHPMERGFTDYYGFLQGSRSYWPLEKGGKLNQLLRDRTPVKPEKFDYMTDELGHQACTYIRKHKDQPFFMYLAFNATHAPMHATKEDLAKTGGNKLAAMTIALDRAVGYVLDELKTDGLLESTLVFFINDNGGAHGHDNAPLHGHKGSTWEGGIRVPYALQWPGTIPKGQVYTAPVISLDIFATAMACAGVNKAPGKPLDGVNLIPFVTGKQTDRPHETLFWRSSPQWAVRYLDLKLVRADNTEPQLFDLTTDIGEQHALSAARPADKKKLLKLYEAWDKQTVPGLSWGKGKKQAGKGGDTMPFDAGEQHEE